LELVGFEKNPLKKKRKVKKKTGSSAIDYTPFKGNFRWQFR